MIPALNLVKIVSNIIVHISRYLSLFKLHLILTELSWSIFIPLAVKQYFGYVLVGTSNLEKQQVKCYKI